jgi:trk system potassium uptake protein TrkH
MRPPLVLALGFVVLIAAGTLLLSLPFANREGSFTPFVVALFTATSAACVTGLVVVDTADYWSPMGQAIILLLIQLGGLGIVTSSTFLWLLVGRQVSLRERVLLSEAQGGSDVGGIVALTRRVLRITLLLQSIGAVVLTVRFAFDHPPDQALWMGVFHSVSAFNNAGFDVMGGFRSLIAYNHDPVVVLTVAALVIVGSISYITLIDVNTRRRWRKLLLETKLVLMATLFLLVGGTVVFLVLEWGNPETLGPMAPLVKVMNAFFSSVSLRTAGFTTIDIGRMDQASLFMAIALMFIGGATGSVAGGIKVNTFAILAVTALSAMRGQTVATAFGRELGQDQIYRALTVAFLSMVAVFAVTLILLTGESRPAINLLFDATSAYSTMGGSTGVTPGLSLPSHFVLILTMYVGRLGPLTVALALVERSRATGVKFPPGEVRVG